MNRIAGKVHRSRRLCRLSGMFLVIVGLWALPASTEEQPQTGQFVNRIYQDEQGDHKYVVFVPRGYAADKQWPVILWLHGASARGRDGRSQLVAGLPPNVYVRKDTFPFLVVFPQNEDLKSRLLGGWTDEDEEANRALKILDEVERHYRVDPKRRILAGVSMGAFGVWSVGARTADRWSALIPVSGGGPQTVVDSLKRIPVWAFHAADDQVVPPVASLSLVEAIQAEGGPAYYTELPDGGHNIGSRVFAKEEIYEWLLDPQQPPRQPSDWVVNRTEVAQLQDEVPFVPGAEVDRSVQVAIGSDLLEAFAVALPAQVPPEALQGARGPQSQTTGTGLMRFQATVAGVQYSGQVGSAKLEPLADNQLRLRIGVQPLSMTVLGTSIQGRLLRANAGPMQAVIGVRRPAWLNVVVRPKIESRQLKLETVSADFTIEPDNWYVTEPNGVDVFPLPILRDRISQRLTDGLYAKRGEIEQQVVAGVPKLVEQIEARAATQFDRVVTFGRWPMPVWQPRAKFWPTDVVVDDRGIVLTLGATLAALAPPSDTVPIRKHAGPSLPPARPTEGVQISVARDVIQVWTEILATSDVRQFHVQDFHSQAFHRLADREFLSQVLPGMIERDGAAELRSVLSFEQPMYVEPTTTANGDAPSNEFRLGGRELRLTISERADRQSPWTPVAEFPIAWSQDFRLSMKKASHRGRKVLMESLSPPQVRAEGRVLVPSDQPPIEIQNRLVEDQFRQGWEATFATALAKQMQLPQRVIADVPLACEGVTLQGDFLTLQLLKPTTQIRNLSREPVTYEIRDVNSDWSQPQVLPPGMMHEYRAAGPLTWRSRTPQQELLFTLPVGSVSHYRGGEEQPLWLAADKPISEAIRSTGAVRR